MLEVITTKRVERLEQPEPRREPYSTIRVACPLSINWWISCLLRIISGLLLVQAEAVEAEVEQTHREELVVELEVRVAPEL